jgi:hypothetical protein
VYRRLKFLSDIGLVDVDILSLEVFFPECRHLCEDHAGQNHQFINGAVMLFKVVEEQESVSEPDDGVLILPVSLQTESVLR